MVATSAADPLPDLAKASLLVLDTNALVYLVEGTARRRAFMEAVMVEVRAGRLDLAVSALAWTELLARPLARGDAKGAGAWRLLLAATPRLRVEAFDVAVAEAAAGLLASSRLSLADAATAATALVIGADALLTNDAALAAAVSLPPSAAVAAGLPAAAPARGRRSGSCGLRALLIDELAWAFEEAAAASPRS